MKEKREQFRNALEAAYRDIDNAKKICEEAEVSYARFCHHRAGVNIEAVIDFFMLSDRLGPDLTNHMTVHAGQQVHNIDGFDTDHMDAHFDLAQGNLEYADYLRDGKIDHREERKLVKFWRRMKSVAGAMHHRLATKFAARAAA